MDNVKKLLSLKETVEFEDNLIRLGASGRDNMSVYTRSKWTDWSAQKRQDFKDCFDIQLIDKSLIGWFLEIPKEKGFLDKMTYWNGKKMAANVTAMALLPDMHIILDGERKEVKTGETITFNLSQTHEINKSPKDQLWACIMHFG